MKKVLALAAVIGALTTAASAATLLTEDFNFTGNLTANGWAAHSGAGTQAIDTTAGLTYTGYAGSGIGNAANLDNTGEDDNRLLPAPITTASDTYASFLVNIPTGTTVTDGYFFHFGQNDAGVLNTSIFRGKTWTTTDGTGDYELGFAYGGSVISKTNLNLVFGTTYLVVVKYSFLTGTATDDTVSGWVFTGTAPGTEPAPTVGPLANDATTEPTNIGAIALRQFVATERVVVDGIRVTTEWPLGVQTAVGDWTAYN
ncbi:hypothetical protein BH09SUM1_BH09SUM1_29620 [soil metagenome]